ncbi:MAG TPA: arylamine N-acetyltransferase [Solirubrobacter sp.]|nr:arylamine N-acetyltransferase [Solirubrobacter sp.]
MISALLARIGLDEMPAADVRGLFTLHRAFLERVPYEDLAVQLGESSPLSEPSLFARLLADGRGGYCFELNTVLAALLRACGFSVTMHQAVVDGPGPTNHMALVVDGAWLADAGLGEGFLDPLPLVDGAHAVGPFTYRVARVPGGWRVEQHEWGSLRSFTFSETVAVVEDFAAHHRRLSSDPASSFVRTLVVQRPLEDRIVTLRSRTLTARGPDVNTRRLLTSSDELASALESSFGITVGGPRLARLWELAAEQHAAFEARAA